MKTLKNWSILIALGLSFALVACGGDDHDDHEDHTDAADAADASDAADATDAEDPTAPAYSFESRFEAGKSSIKYTGQTARQLLINEIKAAIGNITVDNADSVIATLNAFYDYQASDEGFTLSTTAGGEALQTNINEISSGSRLINKIADPNAGDDIGDSTGWIGYPFLGWETALPTAGDTSVEAVPTTPHEMVWGMFAKLETLAQAHAAGTLTNDKIYVDVDTGVDYQQMVQKFLSMAVAFSQGTDDYLYKLTGTLNGGTAKDNTVSDDEDYGYTSMEHNFDEGLGYYGAARHTDTMTLAEIKSPGYTDFNNDGKIDMKSEVSFGHSVNAAKRDIGSTTGTTMTADIFDAFVAARTIISNGEGTDGALTTAQTTALDAEINTIITNWEKAIAATVVHYINDVVDDITAEAPINDLALHWSELKGFSLGLQFNTNSPLHQSDYVQTYCYGKAGHGDIQFGLTEDDCADGNVLGAGYVFRPQELGFIRFHYLVGDSPLGGMGYTTTLGHARDVLKAAYGFETEDVENW